MIAQRILVKAARYLPRDMRSIGKRLYYRDRLPNHPALKKFGTVQDLYYWAVDDDLDTLLLLQNYFSAFYPNLDTSTQGAVTIFDRSGDILGSQSFTLPHCGSARLRVSSLLKESSAAPAPSYGTLEVHIDIPEVVLQDIKGERAFYFWDRFYIGYVNNQGQTCFVHGVDKTHIYQHGGASDEDPAYWYGQQENRQWAPEIPVNIDEYMKFSVIMINRTPQPADVTLTLSDTNDESLSWSVPIPPGGVHRFQLTPENTSALAPHELRMRIGGMATTFGRPAVFKEFRNGAISAMHC